MLLNIDLGELPDEDEALYRHAHIANIACGGHAGDARSMAKAIALCQRYQTAIGAHPSFPDRPGFGREPMDLPKAQLKELLQSQLHALAEHCVSARVTVAFIKPHGALYHYVNREAPGAEALLDAVYAVFGQSIQIIGAPDSLLKYEVNKRGGQYLAEGFADRGRRQSPNGGWELLPRGEPGALLTEAEPVEQMLAALKSENTVSTVCLHGDNPQACLLAQRVRHRLDQWAEQGSSV